ncbi:hypothetical protein ADH76_06760 [Enterocloster clostridioformis]|nr:hypothetical protein A4V08_32960 [Lachnoclostridium sp. YL32]NDO28591.1 long-chain fatty acid--CoA ligase [Enterocloster clostridioformis]OXE71022.1 hypothetical protein ADH76_06760 [Enterocloster clostridioformis]QQR01174.1 AMP-binding protein [Enterocloster clostridioformis]
MRNRPYPIYETEVVSNLKELINFIAKKYNDKPAFIFERKNEVFNISYHLFKQEIDALGTALFDLGIRNKKVALIGENSYEWILAYFAIVNSGNVIIPLDRELTVKDIKNILDASGAEVLIYSDDFSDIVTCIQGDISRIQHYIGMGNISTLIKQGNMLIQNGITNVIEYDINSSALSAILYTSGTTGKPKGVMLSHLALAHNTVAACQYVEIIKSTMLVLPLHHAYGFVASVCVPLLQGKVNYINLSLKNIFIDLKKYKPCTMFLVPLFVETFYNKLCSIVKEQGEDNSVYRTFGCDLKLLICGGAPLDEKFVKGMRDFGITVLNGYGITECSPVVAVNRNHYFRDGSVGQVLNCCEVKILTPDENGFGEICVKGDTVTLGYYENEQATKESFEGEWFKTGDIGFLDSNEFLFVCGRKKNLIILNNGKNVYPEEIEMVLLNVPYIKEAIVYADNNVITAEVFLDTDNEPDCISRLNRDIIEINRLLPAYKNIGKTEIRKKEFPKTTTNKIKR